MRGKKVWADIFLRRGERAIRPHACAHTTARMRASGSSMQAKHISSYL